MSRIALRMLNPPIFVLLLIIGVALQTSVFASYPLLYFQPDVILLATIWCALHRSFTEGGILTLILGHIGETHSASPQGLFMLTYMLVFLGICFLARYVEISSLPSLIILTLGSSFLWKIGGLGVLHLMGLGGNQWRHTLLLLLPGAVVTGIAGIWIYRFLAWLDRMTLKNTVLEEEGYSSWPS